MECGSGQRCAAFTRGGPLELKSFSASSGERHDRIVCTSVYALYGWILLARTSAVSGLPQDCPLPWMHTHAGGWGSGTFEAILVQNLCDSMKLTMNPVHLSAL